MRDHCHSVACCYAQAMMPIQGALQVVVDTQTTLADMKVPYQCLGRRSVEHTTAAVLRLKTAQVVALARAT